MARIQQRCGVNEFQSSVAAWNQERKIDNRKRFVIINWD